MSEAEVYPVPAEVAAHAWINNDQYLEMYKRSVDDPEGFGRNASNSFFPGTSPGIRCWTGISPVDIFVGSRAASSTSAITAWIAITRRPTAIIWEGDSSTKTRRSPTSNCTRMS